MQKMKLAALALSLVGVLAAGNAMALDTATINVSATVLGTCSFDTNTYAMAFGEIDPAGSGDKTASVNLAFTCSNGTTWALDDENGAKTMAGAFTATNMAYSIDGYTLSGLGNGSTQNVTVTGRIADTAYQVAAADVYTDSFTIDINP
jgi:hypothetical protein